MQVFDLTGTRNFLSCEVAFVLAKSDIALGIGNWIS
jgi:hypothetical protein